MIFNKIPILILCYNKLRSLKKLIAITKKYKYFNLYISLDGPISKKDKHNLEVLKYINSLKKNKKYKIRINKYNKGCKIAVSEAISWFFKHQRKGIILEEDCLPNKSFFKFCEVMLDRFEYNKKIGHISGTNPLKSYSSNSSYFFSNYGGIWGWATWKDRWKNYDVKMKGWKTYNKFNLYLKSKNLIDLMLRYYQFNKTYKNKIDTWDYQWTFAKIKNDYLSVIPKKNLIKNVGFNSKAKHTLYKNNSFSKLNRYEIKFPLNHNTKIEHCKKFYDKVVKLRAINLLKKKIYG